MSGDLPPSSSLTRLNVAAADLIMELPTVVLPVKVTALTPGWEAKAAPAVSPNPGITFTTPAGKPWCTQMGFQGL